MGKFNYIASAGTGKTYSLVKTVIQKIKEGETLDSFLILTFTEKAAGEIKERLYKELSRIVEEERDIRLKKRFHSELMKIDLSYTGTFHSVFLRFLKKYPEKTGIDSAVRIYQDSMLKQFLLKEFEIWIEKDFEDSREIWEEAGILSGQEIFELFYTLYLNRTKIPKTEKDLKTRKKKINDLLSRSSSLIDSVLNRYQKAFFPVREKGLSDKIFNNDPFFLKTAVRERDLSRLNLSLTDRGFILKGSRAGNKESREFVEQKVLPYLDEEFYSTDNQLYEILKELYEEQSDYRAGIITDRFLSFLEFFEERKKEEGIIDFDDILIKTDSILDEPQITEKLTGNLRYVFVDEFQDTDKLQISILQKLSKKSIYVFGDPKQCIYQWRAADLDGYFKFVDGFEVVTLDTSYRSSRKIVNFVNSIVCSGEFLSHIDEKYRRPVKANNTDEGLVRIKDISGLNIAQEEYLPYLIDELKKDYSYSQMMILVRTNNLLQKVIKSLQEKRIPVKVYGSGNIFEKEEVKTVLNLLRFIEEPDDPVNIIRVLKSPLLMIEDTDIHRKRQNLKAYNHPVIQLLLSLSCKKFSVPPQDILQEIYRKTDLLPVFSSFDDGKIRVKNLNRFMEIVHRLSEDNYNLRDIILYSETISEPIPESDEENAVEVLTIHRAKGLEKEVVILPFMDRDPYRIMERTVYYKNGKFVLNHKKARSKNYHSMKQELEKDAVDEIERLLYVALTRAKERIYIIRSEKKSTKNSFLKKIEKAIDVSLYTEAVKDIQNEDLTQTAEKPRISIEKAEKIEKFLKKEKEISDSAEKFTTVSKLMEKDRPESQGKGSEISVYTGIIVHSVLEETEFKKFSFEESVKKIKEKLKTVPPDMREKVEKKATEIMRVFEKSQILDELRKSDILFRELPFVIKEKDLFVEGRIDVVYRKNGEIYVMDYKTTAYISQKEIKERYRKQKEYYLKAVSRIFPQEKVHFRIGMLLTGKVL